MDEFDGWPDDKFDDDDDLSLSPAEIKFEELSRSSSKGASVRLSLTERVSCADILDVSLVDSWLSERRPGDEPVVNPDAVNLPNRRKPPDSLVLGSR